MKSKTDPQNIHKIDGNNVVSHSKFVAKRLASRNGGGGGEPPDNMERRLSKLEDFADKTQDDIAQIKATLASINAKMVTRDDLHQSEERFNERLHQSDKKLVAIETRISTLPTLTKIATLIGLFATIIPFYFGLLKHFGLI